MIDGGTDLSVAWWWLWHAVADWRGVLLAGSVLLVLAAGGFAHLAMSRFAPPPLDDEPTVDAPEVRATVEIPQEHRQPRTGTLHGVQGEPVVDAPTVLIERVGR